MDEYKKLLILVLLLTIFLGSVVLVSKPSIITILPRRLTSDSCSIIPYKNGKNLCLGQDAGFKSDYKQAESYCTKIGMRLPTREEAWYVWIASENCSRAFASNGNIAKNKQQFINSCYNTDTCTAQAISVKNYCNTTPYIKFSKSLQYSDGNFWLKERTEESGHYSANYADGIINAYPDYVKTLGVRCIKQK